MCRARCLYKRVLVVRDDDIICQEGAMVAVVARVEVGCLISISPFWIVWGRALAAQCCWHTEGERLCFCLSHYIFIYIYSILRLYEYIYMYIFRGCARYAAFRDLSSSVCANSSHSIYLCRYFCGCLICYAHKIYIYMYYSSDLVAA